ncbi:hypothetical protein A1Q1_06848 [Trichosporon asahii var. asahii CBS 2479]|uniref:Uncharacterized protein n=1 Tax=Trichosporon asahii var. asahii (strain ATCC 90039 / CBS 2479 / JCM 2466 / KCTC 7840 / NBRC 103889/ NCYC 2677 / UAMH 7654) TaxID=1186058 RepID=J4UJG3_TRIAS|nr:hypothetical protein A1Q1_06848 [Trichosporon asahii var. asahii CBS 2479]EJT51925.1 hypothetical protein A1Q1_06848 [Trichosporon asahii var. asahii CBS 2479]
MPLSGGKDSSESTPLPRRAGQRVTYGAVPALQVEPPSTRGSGSVTPRPFNGFAAEEYDDGLDDEDEAQLRSLSWHVLKWVYMLVPLATLVFFAGLVALVTWGCRDERKAGQTYPHPFYWKAFSIGVFASITVQALRVPTFVATSSLRISPTAAVILSTIISTALNEALRLLSVPLTTPSPTSGFHSSFWLGLGWGTAETVWGIVQGYEQLALYEDVLGDAAPQECGACAWDAEDADETYDEFPDSPVGEEEVLLEEEELERRVEVLENMRARRGKLPSGREADSRTRGRHGRALPCKLLFASSS